MMRNKIGAAALALALVFAPYAGAARALASTAGAAGAQDDGPSDAEQSMFTRGQNLFIQGNYEQAISVLRDFLKTYPSSVITDLTLLWLGRSYMQTGRIQDAEQVGQRLRSMRDTPFVDIYESELQTAREEVARRPAATQPPTPTFTATRPRVDPTPAVVAAANPTPTPARAVAREVAAVPNSGTSETTTTPAGSAPRSPRLVNRSEGNSERSRRARQGAGQNRTADSANAGAGAAVPTPSPTPRATPPQRPRRGGGNQEVARATPPTQPPVSTPTAEPSRAPESIDPASTLRSSPASAESSGQSSSFVITVKQVPNLQLALRRAAISASPGQTVQLPLVVTNTGNKDDQFSIETDLPAEFQPTFSAGQGGAGTEVPIMVTPKLQRGANYDVLLNLRIPDNAPDNKQLNFFVRAASQADHQIYKVADAALTVAAAALIASSDLSQEAVMPGETFTQNITMKNQGSSPARGSRVDFVFNPDFELVSANPSPLVYDRASRTAIWSLGEVDSRQGRDITVTLRAVPEALAATRSVGRGTMKTQSLVIPANFDGPSITVGRVPRARIDAVSTGLTATPGDTIYVPFVVRNPGNYPESFEVRVTAPGAPNATVYADTNGDGLHQEGEPSVTQTGQIEPRGGQYPVLLRVDIPRSTPDRQQYAYNVVTRALAANRVASEASTVLTVVTPRVRVRPELPVAEVRPGDTIFYRLVLVNDGAGLAKNLVLTEQLPDALEFISSEPSLNAQDAPGSAQRFVWRVNELSPGDTAVLKIAVRIKQNIEADKTLSPSHSLTFQDGNGNPYRGQ
jgi:uncharacterized repeat protein (TIGR01451 family)